MAETRPLILGIAGGSGCGKTYLAREIRETAGSENVAVLGMDQYFRDEGVTQGDAHRLNFDHPAHLDFDLLISDLQAIRNGDEVWTPAYDFESMTRTDRAVRIKPSRVVIFEGLFVLAEPLAGYCDLTCFLDVASDERLLGRILRDTRERGMNIEQVVDRYQRFVRPSYQVFVEPTKQNADIVVDFTYRRSLLTRMFCHLITDSIANVLDMNAFVANLRRESFAVGANFEAGFMPMTTDIIALSKAIPESIFPIDAGRKRLASPAMSQFETPG
jgi:uridine kinase